MSSKTRELVRWFRVMDPPRTEPEKRRFVALGLRVRREVEKRGR